MSQYNGMNSNKEVLEYMHHRLFFHERLCVAFSRSSLFDSVAVAIVDGHLQHVENERLRTLNVLYREEF
jgi:hypothetical protein